MASDFQSKHRGHREHGEESQFKLSVSSVPSVFKSFLLLRALEPSCEIFSFRQEELIVTQIVFSLPPRLRFGLRLRKDCDL
ncbi:MAG: hypothetical protein COA78_08655 [Blastopirellula sp.]|nr:MAG: hypothetical protein COA78_08655 [Blastopirellula sp.]